MVIFYNESWDDQYLEMEKKLFSNIDSGDSRDFIYHFINTFKAEYVAQIKSSVMPRIIRGKESSYKIKLKPSPGKLMKKNYEFEKAIMEIYNKEYWLIKLWLRMYNDSKNFKIDREIVRAFIKNCIKVTAQELVNSELKFLDKSKIKINLSERPNYYIKIFNSKKIINEMRIPYRKLLRERSDKNKWPQQSLKIEDFNDEVTDSLNAILHPEYVELIDICHENKISSGIYACELLF